VRRLVYYLYASSIVGKKQGGHVYYYLVESARVGGKARIVSQRYLGSAEEIAARLSEAGPGEPDRTRHLSFGDVAATWAVLGRLGVADIVDEVVGARRADAGASVGTYIALATLNRVCDPCSKLAFADWWATTAGDRWLRLRAGVLDHRRFREAMDAISGPQLKEIERRIAARMVEAFSVERVPLGRVAQGHRLAGVDHHVERRLLLGHVEAQHQTLQAGEGPPVDLANGVDGRVGPEVGQLGGPGRTGRPPLARVEALRRAAVHQVDDVLTFSPGTMSWRPSATFCGSSRGTSGGKGPWPPLMEVVLLTAAPCTALPRTYILARRLTTQSEGIPPAGQGSNPGPLCYYVAHGDHRRSGAAATRQSLSGSGGQGRDTGGDRPGPAGSSPGTYAVRPLAGASVQPTGDSSGRRRPPAGRGSRRLRVLGIGAAGGHAGRRALRIYLDSSAIVKLVLKEPESQALRRYLRKHGADEPVTSMLARVEVVRAVGPGGPAAVAHARRRLARMHQVALDAELLDSSAAMAPGTLLRSLDAIHLASAQLVGPDLRAVVTYDQRMRAAAAAMGLPVEAPCAS